MLIKAGNAHALHRQISHMTKKRIKKKARIRTLLKAKFSVGSQVVVKQGTTDPDFTDIPLGGWVGTIRKVDAKSSPPLYLIEWNKDTLDSIHPIIWKRCERDGLEFESMWLEENEIDFYQGRAVAIEQPTDITPKPLSLYDQDDRIKMIMGLTSDDPIPDVEEETLLTYQQYLIENLGFPFDAEYHEETADGFIADHIQVLRLLDPEEFDCDECYGLFCEASMGRRQATIPLYEVQVKKKDANYQLLSDYCYWFWNWR